MEESELKEMFSKYGDIYQLNVLRDKTSGAHRGMCDHKQLFLCNKVVDNGVTDSNNGWFLLHKNI